MRRIDELDRVEVLAPDRYVPKLVVHGRVAQNRRADFAMQLLARAAVMGAASEHDGRPVHTVETIVNRCCEMADMAMDSFEVRGWLTPVPALPDEEKDE